MGNNINISAAEDIILKPLKWIVERYDSPIEGTETISVEPPQSVFFSKTIFNRDEYATIFCFEDIQKIIEQPIPKCKSLHFQFREMNIESINLRSFSRIFEHNSNILFLSLELMSNQITSEGFINCISYVSRLQSLTSLSIDFRENNLSQKIEKELLQQYFSNLSHLQSLSLNLSRSQISSDNLVFISEPLKLLVSLESLSLDISENELSDDFGLEGMGMNISKLEKLTSLSLDLSVNDFPDECMSTLFIEIAQLYELKKLELDITDNFKLSNSITEDLNRALRVLLNLKHLRIDLSQACHLDCLLEAAMDNNIKILSSVYCN